MKGKSWQKLAVALLRLSRLFKKRWDPATLRGARKLLHDDLSFRGPIDTFDAPEPYPESLKKLKQIVSRVDMRKVFVDSDDVCLLHDMVTNTPVATAFIAEWHHVQGKKIGSIRVVFDARPFVAMFAKK
jgi:hypothetical protein